MSEDADPDNVRYGPLHSERTEFEVGELIEVYRGGDEFGWF